MGSLAILQSLKESVLGQASVKAIYGEPISAQGKTVIPVARVMYAYGAGAGTGGVGDTSARGEGGGGGGGVRAVPVGVIEVSNQPTSVCGWVGVDVADTKSIPSSGWVMVLLKSTFVLVRMREERVLLTFVWKLVSSGVRLRLLL